jgi:hypothetical protein
MENLYGGYIVREYFCSDDRIHESVSEKRICVEATSKEAAELIMHEVYARNETKYIPNRTSKNSLGDKVSIRDIVLVEDVKSIDDILEEY